MGIDQNYTTLVGTNLYTVNSDVNTLQVLNTLTNTLMTTITGVGSEYNTILGLLNSENLVGTNLYVLNTYTPLGTVSVINTLNNSVAATITVGSDPRYATVVGTNLYVNNAGTSTVSVINTLNNSVAATIPVGSNPLWSTLVGTNLYVNNSGTSTVSVINTLNNSVTATIPVGSQPQFSSLVGSNLYVFNKGSSTVSVINTLNNSVAATIPVGSSGQYNLQPPILVGTNLYVINEGSNNISVINTLTNTLAATISITGGTQPVLATPVGSNLYVSDYNGAGNPGIATSTVSVIDTLTNRIMDVSAPVLTSFTSASVNGTYTMGQSVNITANFGEALGASSTMTVTLNTGATVTLNTVSGSTLSGTYVVGSGDTPVPELNVARVVGAFVPNVSKTDMGVSYALPPHPQITGQANGNIGDNSNISIAKDYFTIPVGTSPAQIASVGSVLYIANEGSNTVSAFDTNTNIFLGTISVGSEPYGIAYNASSSEIYVSNSGTSTVSVIDANSADGNYNKVIYTIPVGAQPYGIATVGMNVYVANNLSNTVSVITTGNHMVTSTISVGDAPFGVAALGTKIYVTNSNIQQNANSLGEGGSVSVIDANPSDGSYNTVINTIMVGTDPQGVVASGAFVYVSNFIDDTVSLINANTNAVSSTIIVGNGPNGILALGSSVYVENSNDSTISVVGVASSTVSTTIPAGNVPAGMAAVGNNIYLTRFTDGEISVLDTTDNDMVTPATSTPPQSLTAIPGNAQVSLSWSAPSSTGGASLTQYLVYDRFTGSSTFSQIATTSLSVTSSTITSLTNGQSYDFEVIAQNAVGSSTPSNMVSSTPTTIPSAPTVLSGVSGNGQVSLSFTPGSNGGSAILYYTATSNPGNLSASSTGSPIVVTGLINTQGYTFTVTATNINGSSLSSLASASITPAAPIANVGVASGGNYVSAGTQNPTSTVMNSTSSTILTSSSTTITTQTTASLETQLQSLLTQLYALESQAGMPSSNTMTGTISPHSPSSCTPIPIIATKDASYPFTRDLSYNDRGADVLALQQFLIDQNAGPSARSLAQVGATGLFVNKTLLALKEFQTSVCINATGYFGSITRRYLGR